MPTSLPENSGGPFPVPTPIPEKSGGQFFSPTSTSENWGGSFPFTPFILEFSASQLAVGGKSIDDMIGKFGASHPIGRVGTTEETGSLIAYLCSDAAGFITGADLRIDGGLTAQLCI